MALMEIAVIPVGTRNPSVGDFIADVVRVLEAGHQKYSLTDMGTVVEGDAKELLELAGRLHETPFGRGAMRVFTRLEIDDRRDRIVHLRDKTASVQARLK